MRFEDSDSKDISRNSETEMTCRRVRLMLKYLFLNYKMSFESKRIAQELGEQRTLFS